MTRQTDDGAIPELAVPESAALPLNETDSPAESGPTDRIPLPVRLLRWLELWGLHLHYTRVRAAETSDEWLVHSGDGPQGPIPFRQTLRLLLDGQSPIYILHVSKAPTTPGAEAPWIKLSYSPVWNNPRAGRAVTVCFWSVLVLLGFGILTNMVPWRFNTLLTVGYWGTVAGWLWFRYGPQRPQRPLHPCEPDNPRPARNSGIED